MTAAIDVNVLRHQTGGDAELMWDVLGLFAAQAQDVGNEGAAEAARLQASLHRLRGSARAVGANRLAAAAESLEAVLRDGLPASAASIAHLRAEIAAACRDAASLRAGLAADRLAKPAESR